MLPTFWSLFQALFLTLDSQFAMFLSFYLYNILYGNRMHALATLAQPCAFRDDAQQCLENLSADAVSAGCAAKLPEKQQEDEEESATMKKRRAKRSKRRKARKEELAKNLKRMKREEKEEKKKAKAKKAKKKKKKKKKKKNTDL